LKHRFIVDPEVDAGVGGTISNKAEALFGANYPRLQQLKKKYDPEVLFSKWFLIQPQN
jgi:FAD/FMN-containing dehydrogenase